MAISAHRKVVTVLFCDVVGSTALGESVDPEALQALLARYFERTSGIVESHGGIVEKFIGDAVMAVFGVPVTHEDDALRACRAAVEIRGAFSELGVRGRIGVNTGEVLAGTEERLATGDAVNVAARLEQAAEPGEVLIGAETLGLLGGAVEVGDERRLELKGKSEPVAAHPLLTVRDVVERSHASRFVGRERELQQLEDAWDRALAGPRCELVTVVGDAGVGKSRLVAEALGRIEARVVRGRCLPYGEGITYWPVVEVVKQLAVPPSDPVAAAAIRSLLGESEVGTSGDEIAWAVRKLLEEQAPLVVVFDDIQWGDETFLDLAESTALLSAGAPLLLLCVARPELVERRPTWPATLRLEPLPPEQADALIGDAVSGDLRERIARAAGGNPLFISEMLAMAADDSDVDVPPTLKALLAARLDQLDAPERRVLERGSVEGEIFHRGGVQALAPEETQVTTRLAALVRRQLVRPDRAQIAGDDGYRFRHLLIRDAAYDALPKSVRADLHHRFADWLDQHGQALVERDEIVGYHLEQAVRYRAELGQSDPTLAERAAERLAAGGRRADERGDRAGGALLARAAELVRPHRLDLVLELESAFASIDRQTRAKTAEAAAERAAAEGDHSGATLGRAAALFLRSVAGEPDAIEEVIGLCRAALPDEEQRGDPRRLYLLWELLASAANFHQQHDDQVEASLQALRYQRLAGYPGAGADVEWALIGGPRPVAEAMRLIDELAGSRPPGSQDLVRAVFLAMLGNLDEARSLAEARSSHLREVAGTTPRRALRSLAMIEGIGGDPERACRYRAAAIELVADAPIAEAAEKSGLARELCHLDRFEEAEQLLDEARAVPSPGSGIRVMATAAEALLLAHRGELEQAETLARTAVATAETRTDSVPWQAYTHEDLASVLERAGRTDEAREELERALAIWERKGCLPCADRIRAQIDSLGRAAV
ncbi:MAG TPA: adenylate/guanylate cyclase domain-containing protein [Gaiellaceae bacterium]|nr:adenylate/guanylate cyclase domain-containing protein [Gaiellaceae bacterium]